MTRGIDVSEGSGYPDWAAARSAGYSFAYVKISSGLTAVSKPAPKQIAGAQAAGVEVVAGYHYLRSGSGGAAQAEHAVAVLHDLELPALICDCEPLDPPIASDAPELAREVLIDFARRALELRAALAIYGGAAYLASLNLPAYLAAIPLIVAHYGVTAPTIPRPWTSFAVWQNAGNVRAFGATVDLNVAAGTLDELRAAFSPTWTAPAAALAGVARVSAQASGHVVGGGVEDFANYDEGPLIGPQGET